MRRPGLQVPFGRVVTLVAIAALGLGLASCTTQAEDEGREPEAGQDEPISVEMLTPRVEFSDDVAARFDLTLDGREALELDLPDASYSAVARITVQSGARFPWHTHPGPVLVSVAEGDFTYILADDCVERTYTSGQAFIDPGGDNVHTALNPGTTVTVVIAVFLGASDDPDEPLTIPVEAEQQEALTQQCNL